jgi:hypothetical protein
LLLIMLLLLSLLPLVAVEAAKQAVSNCACLFKQSCNERNCLQQMNTAATSTAGTNM